jgi:predicted ArsR family transcriptional regulator
MVCVSKSALDPADREFLLLLQQRGSASVQVLCELAGVTATAIRLRLARLIDRGLIARDVGRAEGRGRPQHSYRITDTGRKELGDNYGELALVLWEEMRGIDDEAIRRRVLDRVRSRMVGSYGAQVSGSSLEQRMEQLRTSLTDRGFRVEVDCAPGALPILRERNCPYHELAAQDPGICELEQRVFEDVLGTRLELVQCSRQGDGCCEFRVHGTAPTA